MSAIKDKAVIIFHSVFDIKYLPFALASYFLCRIFRNSSMLPVDSNVFSLCLTVFSKVITFYIYARALYILVLYRHRLFDWRDQTRIGRITAVLLYSLIFSLTVSRVLYGNRTYIASFIALFSVADYSLKKIIKISYKTQIVLLSIIVFLCSIGAVSNYTVVRDDGLVRNSIGFLYPSCAPQFLMFAAFSALFLRKFIINIKDFLILQLISSLIFILANSRTEFILIEVVLIFSLLKTCHIFDTFSKISSKVLNIVSIVIMFGPVFYLFISLGYNGEGIIQIVNNALSGRISLTHNALIKYGVTMFGNSIQFVGGGYLDQTAYAGSEYNYVDSEYMQLLLTGGVVAFIMFLALLCVYIYYLNVNNRKNEIVFALLCLGFGIINPRIFALEYCPVLFLAMRCWLSLIMSNNNKIRQ